jgi:hypothetical protein
MRQTMRCRRSGRDTVRSEMTLIVSMAVASLIALLACIILAKRDRDAFADRFPPISDEEFISRCGPGTNRQVALKVRRIIAEQLGVDYERIYPSSRFVNDLGAE